MASPRLSAGLLMFRVSGKRLEFFLVHPGGPHFAHKDEGHWTVPKGEPGFGEDLLIAAQREFEEETGLNANGPFFPIGSIKQKGGKIVHAWAFESNLDGQPDVRSNTIFIEWPPKSGKTLEVPEIDRGEFLEAAEARRKIKETQLPFLDRVEQVVAQRGEAV